MTNDRSPDLLHTGATALWRARHGDGPLTHSEAHRFMLGRVETWCRIPENERPCGMREFLGMTEEELASWRTTQVVPARVRRVWGLGELPVPGSRPDIDDVVTGWHEFLAGIQGRPAAAGPPEPRATLDKVTELLQELNQMELAKDRDGNAEQPWWYIRDQFAAVLGVTFADEPADEEDGDDA